MDLMQQTKDDVQIWHAKSNYGRQMSLHMSIVTDGVLDGATL